MKQHKIITQNNTLARYIQLTCAIALSIVIFSCASSGSSGGKSAPMTLSIIHINDHHSHLEPTTIDLNLAGETTRVQLGGFAESTTVIKQQKTAKPKALVLHAGDALTGTIYYSLFKGESDAKVMNKIAWDAFVLGNHEFDDGNQVLKNFLDKLEAPTVAANVVPDSGSILKGAWTPYIIKEVEGQKIGIIGIDIVGKTKNSSNPGPDIKFTDEFNTTKKYVAELSKKGINKIIVLTHIGHDNAVKMASMLDGIDVIVTGDSHSLLGKIQSESLGLTPVDDYPRMVQSPSGAPVAIVQAWEYSKVVGSIDVSFDAAGIITGTEGAPIFPLADSFLRKNASGDRVELTGAARDAVYAYIKDHQYLSVVKPDAEVAKIVAEYQVEKDKIGKQKIGVALDTIVGGSVVRIPQKDASGKQISHSTAQFVAEASLYTLRSKGAGNVDLLIQNAGGVRTPINQGDITTETIFTLLPFANTLVTMEMTGTQIKAALEDSIDYALDAKGSTGSFPYTASLRYVADLTAAKGSRVSKLELNKKGVWSALDMNANYVVGVNSYIASGKDGYIALGDIEDSKKIDTYLEYAQVVIDYIKDNPEIKSPENISVTLK